MTLDRKLIQHIVPGASIIFVTHKVPVRTLFEIGIANNGDVSSAVERGLTLKATVLGSTLDTISTVVVTRDGESLRV